MTDINELTTQAEVISNNAERLKFDWSNITLPSIIENRKFSGDVNIAYALAEKEKTVFINCEFDNLFIKNIKKQNITQISFNDCKIKSLQLFRCASSIKLNDCEINSMDVSDSILSSLRIETSQLRSIFLKTSCNIDSMVIANESNIDIIDSNNSINNTVVHSSRVQYIRFRGHAGNLTIKSGGFIDRVLFDKKEYLSVFFIELRKKLKSLKHGTISQKTSELKYQQQIIRAIYDSYASENRFQELDICLIELRKANCRLSRIATSNPLRKSGYVIEDIVLGKMFGWGVKIANSLLTSLIIILIFGVLYFLAIKDNYETILECIKISLLSSVNRFFNVNETNPISILGDFDTIENIFGAIIMTIFTGVIARKIIR